MKSTFSFWHIGAAILVCKMALVLFLFITIWPEVNLSTISLDDTFLFFIGVGFVAQIIDGALGMAYGVSCSSMLLYFGVSPRVASAAVHTAEVFTTGVSGLSHLRFGNLDRPLFLRIVFTGVIGAMVGAYLISEIFDGSLVKPVIAGYLLILGIVIIVKGIRNRQRPVSKVKYAEWLALFGGFMDAVGGGGWGPIVTSNIIHQGNDPRETIGTVNTAEFFVTFFSTGIFLVFVGIESWPVVLGLIVGGVIAAPLGAWLASKADRKVLMLLIGLLIILTSTLTLVKYW